MKKICLFLSLMLNAAFAFAATAGDEEMLDTSYTTLQEVLMPRVNWKRSDIVSVPKFGGYVIGSYKYNGQDGDHGGPGFGLRLIRLYVDGTILKDIKYRLQLEVNDKPHVKDAYVAWSHWKELEVKMGEFKRCFTFENPYHPFDVGVGDYSQLTKKLSGFSDRCGEASANGGRDIGIQVQGDVLTSKRDGHPLIHYALGIFNGQGVNTRDLNHGKDVIGTLQYSPVKDLWVGVFGWKGGYTGDGITVDRKRLAVGMKYEGSDNHISARAEYVHSRGHKVSDYVPEDDNYYAHWAGGNKADAWYVTVGYPVWQWIKCYARYDCYRDYASKASSHTIWSLSANLQPHKNLMLQIQYNYHDNHTSADRKYHEFWAQTYVRF